MSMKWGFGKKLPLPYPVDYNESLGGLSPCPSPVGRCPGPARDVGGPPIPRQYRAPSIINTWGAFY